MKDFQKYIPFLLLAIGFVLLSVPLWLKIDVLPLRLWDESRNAVSAIEMYETQDWLVSIVDYVPDNWDLKPPLLT